MALIPFVKRAAARYYMQIYSEPEKSACHIPLLVPWVTLDFLFLAIPVFINCCEKMITITTKK